MSDFDRLYLVGLMGAGKSSVGTIVAATLGRPYLDNDTELYERTGRTATEWATLGPAQLHDAEADYVRATCGRTDSFVAAVAASVADRRELWDAIQSSGTIVYLRAQPHTLGARVASDPERPWLSNNAETVLTEMFAVRDEPLRELADIVIDTDDLRANEIADLVVRATQPRQ